MKFLKEREEVLTICQKLVKNGLMPGKSGNVSIRLPDGEGYLVTPSGMEYLSMTAIDLVRINTEGEVVHSKLKPTSELALHLAVYDKRCDAQAVIHTHSHYATTIACLGIELPAVHYMVACSGDKVPLAKYHTFGTEELAQEVGNALGQYNALLLENHGLLALGTNLERAYYCAESVEFVARIYWQALSIGKPRILTEKEMAAVICKFQGYGQQNLNCQNRRKKPPFLVKTEDTEDPVSRPFRG